MHCLYKDVLKAILELSCEMTFANINEEMASDSFHDEA